MNGKSRYFSSLLIAIVAAFGYYMLTDFNIKDIKLKTFSSLGVPYRMYQANNSVKQKKLPLPKVVYAYAVQDELKSPPVELIADAQEFIEGLTLGLTDALDQKKKSNKNDQKINRIAEYGKNDNGAEILTEDFMPYSSVPQINKDCQKTFTVKPEITQEDIEMVVNTVSEKNVKKIEECFKKIKVLYGNESGSLKNSIVKITGNPNKQDRSTCAPVTSTSECTKTTFSMTSPTKIKKVTPVASEEEGETYYDDEEEE